MTGTPSQAALAFRTEMVFAYGEPRELVPGVVRIVANNPGPFTYKGTNTYVIGSRSLAVIDPGPDDPAHREAILRYAAGRPISHILVTHTHRDHVDGLPALATATGAIVCGYGRAGMRQDPRIGSPTGRSFIDVDFAPDRPIRHGDVIAGDDWSVEALFTPGHAPDHLCFDFPAARVLFSGDHVMGWNTTVVAPPEGHMGDYLNSLEVLVARDTDVYLPGHGGRIPEPRKVAKAYLVHRRLREQAVLDAIRRGITTISDIVALIYKGLDDKLVTAASLSVQAHVEHLIERGLIAPVETLGFATPLAPA